MEPLESTNVPVPAAFLPVVCWRASMSNPVTEAESSTLTFAVPETSVVPMALLAPAAMSAPSLARNVTFTVPVASGHGFAVASNPRAAEPLAASTPFCPASPLLAARSIFTSKSSPKVDSPSAFTSIAMEPVAVEPSSVTVVGGDFPPTAAPGGTMLPNRLDNMEFTMPRLANGRGAAAVACARTANPRPTASAGAAAVDSVTGPTLVDPAVVGTTPAMSAPPSTSVPI